MAGKYDSSRYLECSAGLARGAHESWVEHWGAVAKILQRLKGTREIGLTYHNVDCCRLEAFADANYTEAKEDRRSVVGIVTKLDGIGVSWSSRTQTCVTISSSEAWYKALVDYTKDVLYLRISFVPGCQISG